MSRKLELGQSLIEIVVALAIAALIAVGLVKATSFSVKNSRFSADQSQLTAIAQQKMADISYRAKISPAVFWGQKVYLEGCSTGGAGSCTDKDFDSVQDACFLTKVDSNVGWSGQAPVDPEAKVVKVIIEVYWGQKVADAVVDCDEDSYNHKLIFETNVTN